MTILTPVAPPALLLATAARIDHELASMLDAHQSSVPNRLWQAMRYSLLAGGKRIRPTLLLSCFAACGGKDETVAMPAALALDCLHTYSLIHDDLPCMDDDAMRRGQPTCHCQFDEATAVLAADALHSLAFGLLMEGSVSDATKVALCQGLELAAGCRGMVGGQMLDMEAEGKKVDDLLQVERIHLHKTGALLRFACEAGARLAGAGEAQLHGCQRYGEALGLLFQIVDDILDATASSEVLGKSAGKDAMQHKATYVSLLGLEQARERAQEMCDLAREACAVLGQSAVDAPLYQLADYILHRSH
ncbi:MAG: polyprenyl synthetase family protein [Mariprofundales bacterium]|nr:polyprenyl synthetase family protein [Mariprofundales bacterium]